MRAADRLLSGDSLSVSLEGRLVPPVVPSLFAAGERSGSLTAVLAELSRHYEQDLAHRIRRMSALVEPILILLVGGMVAFVYLSFFQALISLARG
jgi:type IV pilus assembly protein PilC